MSDKELLELAAKAAGYEIDEHARNGSAWAWVYHKGSIADADGDFPIFKWSPCNDDGDAIRLAASLNLCVCFTLAEANPTFGTAMVGYSPWENKVPISAERYSEPSEKLAATRRAIVRAAAEIGKSMQP